MYSQNESTYNTNKSQSSGQYGIHNQQLPKNHHYSDFTTFKQKILRVHFRLIQKILKLLSQQKPFKILRTV